MTVNKPEGINIIFKYKFYFYMKPQKKPKFSSALSDELSQGLRKFRPTFFWPIRYPFSKYVKFPKKTNIFTQWWAMCFDLLVILINLLWLLSVNLKVEKCHFVTCFKFSALHTKLPKDKLSKPLNELVHFYMEQLPLYVTFFVCSPVRPFVRPSVFPSRTICQESHIMRS